MCTQTQGITGGARLEWRVFPAPEGTDAGRGSAEALAGLGCPGRAQSSRPVCRPRQHCGRMDRARVPGHWLPARFRETAGTCLFP